MRDGSDPVLALDLERTLIDSAITGRPRPGLADFLAFCDDYFRRVVIFTTVNEADAWAVLDGLAGPRIVARIAAPPTRIHRLVRGI